MNNPTKICKGMLLLLCAILLAGCYRQPSADTIKYDADAVEEMRDQVDAMDWD